MILCCVTRALKISTQILCAGLCIEILADRDHIRSCVGTTHCILIVKKLGVSKFNI